MHEGRDLLLGPDGQARLLYRRTLQNYTKFFRPEQILIVFYEAITQDPHRLLAEVFQFLEVPHRDYTSSELTERINEGSISLPLPEPLRITAAEKYRADVEALAQVLGGYTADWGDQLNSPDSKATPVERIRPPTVRLTAEIMAQLE